MFTFTHYMVTPAGTVRGTAVDKSPKKAFLKAQLKCEEAYHKLGAKVGQCLSVGVDGWSAYRGSKLIGRADNY